MRPRLFNGLLVGNDASMDIPQVHERLHRDIEQPTRSPAIADARREQFVRVVSDGRPFPPRSIQPADVRMLFEGRKQVLVACALALREREDTLGDVL